MKPKRVVRVAIGIALVIPYVVLVAIATVGEWADNAINWLWFKADKLNSWSNRE